MNVSTPQRIRSRVLAGGLLLAAIVTGAAAAGPAALASPATASSAQTLSGVPISWSESPASATAPDNRATYSYANIKPGSKIFDHVEVFNRSSVSIAFMIYATDAVGTTADNVLELLPYPKKPHDIGSWVRFPKGATRVSVIIPADHGIIEPFTLAVPRDATPGDHTGGLAAQVGFPRRTSKGSVVVVYQRIAVPIELRVTGRLRAGLQVESISTGFRDSLSPFSTGAATVTYSVLNTGNVRLAGRQIVSVTGPFGSSSKLAVSLPTVLPGDSVRYSVQVGGLYPLGPMTAHVSVSPALPEGAPAMALPAGYVTGTASLFAVPWSLIVLVLLLIGAGFAGFWGRGWWHRHFRARLDAVAESARRETERRLLGDKDAAGQQRQA